VLSHDCDQLRGNDVFTQGVRLYRTARSVAELRPGPAWRNARAFVENTLRPRRYFWDNMMGMIDLERQFGFRSVSYLLTGSGGRFGARSGSPIARAFASTLPAGFEIGMHYNYDTHGDPNRFAMQRNEIGGFIGKPITAGRAHYLRFDPLKSPEFLAGMGIELDESLGWADRLAYRAGIAGPFRSLARDGDRAINLIELPLVFTDTPLADCRNQGMFEAMFRHLCCVGGIATILVHPGAFDNPEVPENDGLYLSILERTYHAGSRSWTPGQILAEAKRLDR